VRPPSENAPIEKKTQSKKTQYLKNAVGLDLSWMIRGNAFLAYERIINDNLSLRATCGLSFGDFLDGLLYEGFKSMNENTIEDIRAGNTLNYGIELRYYPMETGYFDSGYIGGGMMLRNYNYTGIFDQSNIDPFFAPTNVSIDSRSSNVDLYVRYGGQVRLTKSQSNVLFLEYGLILGYSFGAFDQIGAEFPSFNSPNNTLNPVKFRESSASYLILPVLSLGYGY
jgi:hypothetical protein